MGAGDLCAVEQAVWLGTVGGGTNEVSMGPRLTTQEHWNGIWTAQLRAFNPKKASHVAIDDLFDSLLESFCAQADKRSSALRILELGVGGSFWLGRLAERLRCRGIGLDYSYAGCRLALASSGDWGNVTVVQSDVLTPPLVQGQFNFVYSLGLVEHFTQPRAVLHQAFDLLTPGGLLMTMIPNKAGIAGFVERLVNPENFRRHLPLRLADLLSVHRDVGFEAVDGTYFGALSAVGTLSGGGPGAAVARPVKRALNGLIFYPLYLRSRFRPRWSLLSSQIAVWGIRPIQPRQ